MMLKLAILFTILTTNTLVFGQDEAFPDFESELRALETNQLKTEELQMRNVDAVTDVISDEVATGQAATVREIPVEKADEQPKEKGKEGVQRTRRIRSR